MAKMCGLIELWHIILMLTLSWNLIGKSFTQKCLPCAQTAGQRPSLTSGPTPPEDIFDGALLQMRSYVSNFQDNVPLVDFTLKDSLNVRILNVPMRLNYNLYNASVQGLSSINRGGRVRIDETKGTLTAPVIIPNYVLLTRIGLQAGGSGALRFHVVAEIRVPDIVADLSLVRRRGSSSQATPVVSKLTITASGPLHSRVVSLGPVWDPPATMAANTFFANIGDQVQSLVVFTTISTLNRAMEQTTNNTIADHR